MPGRGYHCLPMSHSHPILPDAPALVRNSPNPHIPVSISSSDRRFPVTISSELPRGISHTVHKTTMSTVDPPNMSVVPADDRTSPHQREIFEFLFTKPSLEVENAHAPPVKIPSCSVTRGIFFVFLSQLLAHTSGYKKSGHQSSRVRPPLLPATITITINKTIRTRSCKERNKGKQQATQRTRNNIKQDICRPMKNQTFRGILYARVYPAGVFACSGSKRNLTERPNGRGVS